MGAHENSDEREYSSSIPEDVMEFREAISTREVPLTSTSTTTCETSFETSTTEPPLYHSEIDEHLYSTEFMEKELIEKTNEFFLNGMVLNILIILTLSLYTFVFKIIPLRVGLPFIVGMTILFFSLNDLRWS